MKTCINGSDPAKFIKPITYLLMLLEAKLKFYEILNHFKNSRVFKTLVNIILSLNEMQLENFILAKMANYPVQDSDNLLIKAINQKLTLVVDRFYEEQGELDIVAQFNEDTEEIYAEKRRAFEDAIVENNQLDYLQDVTDCHTQVRRNFRY